MSPKSKLLAVILISFSALCVSALNAQNDVLHSSKTIIELADPTIFPDDGTYYLYGTEPPPQSGFQVLQSSDLVNWKIPDQTPFKKYALLKGESTYGEKGFWAPQVLKINKRYYIFYTVNERIAVASSGAPYGPFQQAEITSLNNEIRQIDPFIFIDDDGKVYLYHVRLNKGNHIYVAEMNADLMSVKEETLTHCLTAESGTWEDTRKTEGPKIAEGPTVIKHNGTYYLLYSCNDFRNPDYAVGYATSKSPFGPWTRHAANPIISIKTSGINGSGHGDVFRDKAGGYYYVFHTHASNEKVHPRKTAIVKLRMEEGSDGILNISSEHSTFRFLER